MAQPEALSQRRRWMLKGLGVTAALAAFAPYVPFGEFLTSALGKEKPRIKIANIRDDDIAAPGSWKDFSYPRPSKEDPFSSSILLHLFPRDAAELGVEFIAFNKICVHLRCLYNYNPCTNRHECPCHGSVYNSTGVPIGGPAFTLGLNPLPEVVLEIDNHEDIYATDLIGVIGIGRPDETLATPVVEESLNKIILGIPGFRSVDFSLTSSAFKSRDTTVKHTCFGNDLSPPLSWSGFPSTTKAFALIVDELEAVDVEKEREREKKKPEELRELAEEIEALEKEEATKRLQQLVKERPRLLGSRWVLFDIPGTVTELPGDVKNKGTQGTNDTGILGYTGPCAVGNIYEFRLYALNESLDLKVGESKSDVMRAIEGHTLGMAFLCVRT